MVADDLGALGVPTRATSIRLDRSIPPRAQSSTLRLLSVLHLGLHCKLLEHGISRRVCVPQYSPRLVRHPRWQQLRHVLLLPAP